MATKKNQLLSKISAMSLPDSSENLTEKEETTVSDLQDVLFDVDKCVNCSIEGNNVIAHSSAGKGYGLGLTAMRNGCYKWKVQSYLCYNISVSLL